MVTIYISLQKCFVFVFFFSYFAQQKPFPFILQQIWSKEPRILKGQWVSKILEKWQYNQGRAPLGGCLSDIVQ